MSNKKHKIYRESKKLQIGDPVNKIVHRKYFRIIQSKSTNTSASLCCCLSILPKSVVRQQLYRQPLVFQAANATPIATFDMKSLSLNWD